MQAAPHVSKAQKRRQTREQEDAEREQRIADELAQMGDSERAVEERSLAQLLQPLGLAVQDIPVSRAPCLRNVLTGTASLADQNPWPRSISQAHLFTLNALAAAALSAKQKPWRRGIFSQALPELPARLLMGAWRRRLMGTVSTGRSMTS